MTMAYDKRIKDVRMALVPKFPFGLWFRVVDDSRAGLVQCCTPLLTRGQ
jgi:hypothetical protein